MNVNDKNSDKQERWYFLDIIQRQPKLDRPICWIFGDMKNQQRHKKSWWCF